MDLFDLAAKITLDKKDFDTGISEATAQGQSLAHKFGPAIATAAKVGMAAAGAAATAVGAVATKSIKEYAKYEQLVGGVETLFKDSADTVQEYAENAYKTAGMSANDYMETVTSFSASLLQSLDGDTATAAKKADKAITDMADNANKMGTSMESIQYAYQGFAKQNFTMLDNLKLGYGGTKQEMERLLKDAQKLSGIKYDISSYADIVDAIHVVQKEMGIAGTTAEEASSTIEGSLNSMKSAWSNLLTGISDESADMPALIDSFVESTATAAENLLPRIEIALAGIGQLVEGMAPIIGEHLPMMIANVLPSLLSAGIQLLSGIANGFISALPQLFTATVQLAEQLFSGIVANIPKVLESIPQIITAFVNFMTENFPAIIQSGMDLLGEFLTGIIDAIPDFIEGLPEVISAFTDFIITNFPVIIQSGIDLLGKLLEGIIEAIPEIAKKIPEVITAITDAFAEGWDNLKQAGKDLLENLWEGIGDKIEWLKRKVRGVVDKIKSWFTGKDGFDEHSPSKWSRKVFEYIMEGGAQGLERGKQTVSKVAYDTVNDLKDYLGFGGVAKTAEKSLSKALTPTSSGVSGKFDDKTTPETDEPKKPKYSRGGSFSSSGAGRDGGSSKSEDTVRFSDSAVGKATQTIVNEKKDDDEKSIPPIYLNLVLPDGALLASYLFDPLVDYGAANGTPILNPL